MTKRKSQKSEPKEVALFGDLSVTESFEHTESVESPPGERNCSVEEVEDCRPLLLRQILAVNPRVIIAFGALAAQTLLRSKKTISDLRGHVYTLRLNGREIALVPTFNPAYLLRVAEK